MAMVVPTQNCPAAETNENRGQPLGKVAGYWVGILEETTSPHDAHVYV